MEIRVQMAREIQPTTLPRSFVKCATQPAPSPTLPNEAGSSRNSANPASANSSSETSDRVSN